MNRKIMTGWGVFAFALLTLPASAQVTAERKAGDVPGPIDSLSDLQDSARMAFVAADENGDGQISQKEALDAANLAVGGFFFRADTNGDGVLSPEEERQARDAFFASKPWARYVTETAKASKASQNNGNAGTQNPLQNLNTLVDSNNDKQIQATEVRQVVQTAVQSAFATADTNRDGQLSPAEINAAAVGAARAIARASFEQADTDHNGQISQAEFEKAIIEPSRTVFSIMDLNHDGQISEPEAQTFRQLVMTKMKEVNFPEPSNSPRNTLNRALGTPSQPNQGTQPPAPPAR